MGFAAVIMIISGIILMGLYAYTTSNKHQLTRAREILPFGRLGEELVIINPDFFEELEPEEVRAIRERRHSKLADEDETLEEKLYQAGIRTPLDKRIFYITLVFLPLILTGIVVYYLYSIEVKPILLISAAIANIFLGATLPLAALDRIVEGQKQKIRTALPAMLDSILISVSGGLSLSSTIQGLVVIDEANDDRDPAVDLLRDVLFRVERGQNLDGSLMQTAEASPLVEVRHSFRILAQCERYGGDVSRQLVALSDHATELRFTSIEKQLAALPVKATGPLAIVFGGFFAFLFSSLFTTVAKLGFSTSF